MKRGQRFKSSVDEKEEGVYDTYLYDRQGYDRMDWWDSQVQELEPSVPKLTGLS